ncbi:hypothetical protein D3C80_2111320 [compost metagenome]
MMESVPRIDILMLQEASCKNEKVKLAFEKQLEHAGCTLIHTNAVDRVMTIIFKSRASLDSMTVR